MKTSLIIIAVILVIIFLKKSKITYNKITGSGNVINEDRNLEPFNSIKIIGSIDVNVNYSNDYNCSVNGDDNLISYIITEVLNNELNISINKNYSTNIEFKKRYFKRKWK